MHDQEVIALLNQYGLDPISISQDGDEITIEAPGTPQFVNAQIACASGKILSHDTYFNEQGHHTRTTFVLTTAKPKNTDPLIGTSFTHKGQRVTVIGKSPLSDIALTNKYEVMVDGSEATTFYVSKERVILGDHDEPDGTGFDNHLEEDWLEGRNISLKIQHNSEGMTARILRRDDETVVTITPPHDTTSPLNQLVGRWEVTDTDYIGSDIRAFLHTLTMYDDNPLGFPLATAEYLNDIATEAQPEPETAVGMILAQVPVTYRGIEGIMETRFVPSEGKLGFSYESMGLMMPIPRKPEPQPERQMIVDVWDIPSITAPENAFRDALKSGKPLDEVLAIGDEQARQAGLEVLQ